MLERLVTPHDAVPFDIPRRHIDCGKTAGLDEPEAALSPQRQLSVLTLIHRLIYHQSQLVIATHSPILLAYPNARIYLFSNEGISEVKYSETEHYQITKDFLNSHERMLQLLISAEEEDLESKRRKH